MSRKAFTLAEVLITLTIIGVIAALTIPNLMRKWQDQHTVSAVKEAYTIIGNALKMAIAQNGAYDQWDWPDPSIEGWGRQTNANVKYLGDTLLQYLKIQKDCGTSPCFNNTTEYKSLDGTKRRMNQTHQAPTTRYLLLQNGMYLAIEEVYPKTGFGIFVDINGQKGPNRLGYDEFYFYTSGEKISYYPHSNTNNTYCNRLSSDARNGLTCSYWIMKHGNVDYKYRDVSAEW